MKKTVIPPRNSTDPRLLDAFFNDVARRLQAVRRGIFSGTANASQTGAVTGTLVPTGLGSATLWPGYFGYPGRALSYEATGHYTTDGTPGNATFIVKLGSTTILTSGAFALDASQTDKYFKICGTITARTSGGTVIGQAMAQLAVGNGTNDEIHGQAMVTTSAITLDTTIAQAFGLDITMDNAGNTFTVTNLSLWEEF